VQGVPQGAPPETVAGSKNGVGRLVDLSLPPCQQAFEATACSDLPHPSMLSNRLYFGAIFGGALAFVTLISSTPRIATPLPSKTLVTWSKLMFGP